MEEVGELGRRDRLTWFTMASGPIDATVVQRCTSATVQEALRGVEHARVLSVTINDSGTYKVPDDPVVGLPGYVEESLPPYCQVLVEVAPPGARTVAVEVWVPLRWNGRFLGLGGGNNRTRASFTDTPGLRFITLATAVRNGFATATTDGGVGSDPRFHDWQLNSGTGELDWDLIENWVHRSTHEMTAIGKAVTAAIHGNAPLWSYFKGTSGGGRQAVVSAQRHPEDYDGVWASDPAINWTRFVPAGLWPALVMKEHHVLPPAKLDAFCEAVPGGATIDRACTEQFEPQLLVGRHTAAGKITEADAQVMQLIWDGPRAPDGEQLWFGLLPGVESWGATIMGGVALSEPSGSDLTLTPLPLYTSWFGSWVQRDESFDWRTLTFERYAELFRRGIEELAAVASDDPDLSGLRAAGHKLLITQGVNDQIIFAQGAVHYYDRVLDRMGGTAATRECARFFLCPGDGHGGLVQAEAGVTGPTLDVATGMVALMRWVEEGLAPEQLETRSYDEAGHLVASHLVEAYPTTATPQ